MANVPQLVVTIHGVQSRGEWQDTVHPVLSAVDGLIHEPHNYGRFWFWNTVRRRRREAEIQSFYEKYSSLRETHPDALPSVIAHSFGTYVVAHALARYDAISIDRLILCGSVVARDYNWAKLVAAQRIGAIRNEVARDDPVVRLFRFRAFRMLVPGAGASGIDGFGLAHEALSEPRFEHYRHSDQFVTKLHCSDFWLPFLRGTESFKDVCARALREVAGRESFDTAFGAAIRHSVAKFFHSRHPSAEQLSDYAAIVSEWVVREGCKGRYGAEQLILRETLALLKVIESQND